MATIYKTANSHCLSVHKYRPGIVCQMLPWWTKYSPHSTNIRDIFTKVLPTCSIFQMASYTSMVFAHVCSFSMLFIPKMACTGQDVSRISNMLEYANFHKTEASRVELGSYNWLMVYWMYWFHIRDNTSDIFMNEVIFFIHCVDIWRLRNEAFAISEHQSQVHWNSFFALVPIYADSLT